jgi:RNA 2',3'-cyclic 3'-phosphodiesterase
LSLRLFVALDLPPDARAALGAFRDRAADPELWRPLGDDSLHLTLAFLGHRPESDVERVAAVLRRPPGPAPRLVLGSALALPPRRPRVLGAAIDDPDGTLALLQEGLTVGLEKAGAYAPEARRFRPHVTVARLRPGARAPRTAVPAPAPLEFHGAAVTLYESRLRRSGAGYEVLSSIPLSEPQAHD